MEQAEFEQRLLKVARGLERADLVLKGGKVFNSFTGEWETADVAVCGGVIAGIGSYKGAEEYNMAGKFLTPGFLDAHMHIESTMLAPRELARLLLLNGVTGIFADPHEIANVLGTEGLQWMLDEIAVDAGRNGGHAAGCVLYAAFVRTGNEYGNERRSAGSRRFAAVFETSARAGLGRDDELSRRAGW